MVAERSLQERVVLLRQQSFRAGEVDHRFKQALGIVGAAGLPERIDQPAGADEEAPFAARQAVVGKIPKHRRPHPQLPLDRRDRRQKLRVGALDEPRQADQEHRRIEIVALIGGRVGAGLLVPGVGQDVGGDLVTEGLPGGSAAVEKPLRDPDAPVDRQPAHHLGVNVVPTGFADLPDAVVGLVPAGLDRIDHRLDQPPVLAGDRRLGQEQLPDQLGNRPEHVELNLPASGVAHPHRTRAGIAGQFGDLGFGPDLVAGHGIERHQPLWSGRPVDHAQHPIEEVHRLPEGAEFDKRRGRHRRIPQPAVAVVPVADAADVFREAGGGRRRDPAGGPVAEPLEHQGTATNERRFPPRQHQPVGPGFPVGLREPVALLGHDRRLLPQRACAVAEFHPQRFTLERDRADGRLMGALFTDLPADARGP